MDGFEEIAVVLNPGDDEPSGTELANALSWLDEWDARQAWLVRKSDTRYPGMRVRKVNGEWKTETWGDTPRDFWMAYRMAPDKNGVIDAAEVCHGWAADAGVARFRVSIRRADGALFSQDGKTGNGEGRSTGEQLLNRIMGASFDTPARAHLVGTETKLRITETFDKLMSAAQGALDDALGRAMTDEAENGMKGLAAYCAEWTNSGNRGRMVDTAGMTDVSKREWFAFLPAILRKGWETMASTGFPDYRAMGVPETLGAGWLAASLEAWELSRVSSTGRQARKKAGL